MDAEVRNEELSSDDISVIVHRFTAIASYTSAVLLRDFKETLSHEDRTLCECIIFSIGDYTLILFEKVIAGKRLIFQKRVFI